MKYLFAVTLVLLAAGCLCSPPAPGPSAPPSPGQEPAPEPDLNNTFVQMFLNGTSMECSSAEEDVPLKLRAKGGRVRIEMVFLGVDSVILLHQTENGTVAYMNFPSLSDKWVKANETETGSMPSFEEFAASIPTMVCEEVEVSDEELESPSDDEMLSDSDRGFFSFT